MKVYIGVAGERGEGYIIKAVGLDKWEVLGKVKALSSYSYDWHEVVQDIDSGIMFEYACPVDVDFIKVLIFDL